MSGHELLLLGSLPGKTAEEAFRWVCDAGLASHLPAIPDGEVGERASWITGQAYRVLHGHPDIETVIRPTPIDGVENWKPLNGLANQWSFRLRAGVAALRFGEPGWRLGYTRDAINSFFVFRTLKEKGVIPAGVRFQVSLPLPLSTCAAMFRTDPKSIPAATRGYCAAMAAEIRLMVQKIPPQDLAIQWDSAGEARALDDPNSAALVREEIEMLSAAVPAEALMSYHLRHGSLTSFFMFRPKDLGEVVRCMNLMLDCSRRNVDFIHFPIVPHASDRYYEPLRDLACDRARFYLGVVHTMQDRDDFRRRIERARRYLPEFGIGAPCGYGRLNPACLPAIRDDHLTALRLMHD